MATKKTSTESAGYDWPDPELHRRATSGADEQPAEPSTDTGTGGAAG